MDRRRYLIFLTAVFACARSEQRLDEVLPEQIGDWKRGPLSPVPEIPPAVARIGVNESAMAVYSGNGTVRVHIFRMETAPSAFELMQTWRQSDALATYKGRYFILGQPDSADQAAARSLLQSLQQAIN